MQRLRHLRLEVQPMTDRRLRVIIADPGADSFPGKWLRSTTSSKARSADLQQLPQLPRPPGGSRK